MILQPRLPLSDARLPASASPARPLSRGALVALVAAGAIAALGAVQVVLTLFPPHG